jgi:MerR family transcriptional regulator/heat shock protein HspR
MSDQPVYTIRIAAQLVGVHQQTLRTYEREGLLAPARSSGRQRLYSQADIDRLLMIRRLIDELGVNIAGADIILRLRTQIDDLQTENRTLKRELQRIRDQQLPAIRNIRIQDQETERRR